MAKDEAYKQAEKKIQQALQSGATELELRNMKLAELPESIGQLKQLTSLNLSNNQLTTLPLSLGQLAQLTSLYLSENQLTTLPDSLGQLTQLQTLDLSYNKLKTLPESLSNLKNLGFLDLRQNNLTEYPAEISHLIKLERLYFGEPYHNRLYGRKSNKIEILPPTIKKLANLRELYLSNNELTTLPPEIGSLSNLKVLGLNGNMLTKLPIEIFDLQNLEILSLWSNQINSISPQIKELVNLSILSLKGNQFTKIPSEICSLTKLKYLSLGNKGLSKLPQGISKLKDLTVLNISEMQLEKIPEEIFHLINLERLILYENRISDLPTEIAQLTKLTSLIVNGNQIVDLPPSLAQLEHLETLELKGNPLNPALQSAYEQGLDAVKAYLRSLEGNAEPLYEAKLVLVGEGGVGKTTLLNALMNKQDRTPKPDEATTHGVKIDVNALQVSHPEKEGVNIQLNAWDFGGQEVYRVTHQFFFSRRSIYLLVWEPRRGVQQCQVEDWLNMIRLRVGDEARVIIVSTNSKSGGHIARIDQPVFKQQYGEMIVSFHEVDSLVLDESTGEMVGIAELKRIIAEESIKFNHVGMLFNNDWKEARDELIARPEAHISYETFTEVCSSHKLSEIDTSTLAAIMNRLGYIVHYSDDEKLRDDVVLKPEWLTKAIGFVLEDRATAESEGILPDKHLYEVWHNHQFKDEPRYSPDLYPFFLRLMEKYDVLYRLPDDRKASLVAQHVPQVRPELPWLPEQEPPKNQRRIAMVCSMEEDPPGLVPWMIVRTHDYSVEEGKHHLHWQKGAFLRHGTHGTALLEKRGREFHVYTQGIYPEYLMNVLQETLQKLINDNWPGMEGRYRFTVPCPETVEDQPCKGRFNIHALRQFLAEGDSSVRCQECSKKQSIAKLLLGFEERAVEIKLQEINQKLDGIDSRIADVFMAMMKAVADEAKHGPRLFTFRERDAGFSLKQLFKRPLEIQLWCEAEGHQHRVIESGKGVYPIDQPHDWVVQIAPYANFALNVLKTVMPVAAPTINTVMGANTTENWKDELDLSKALLDKLSPIKDIDFTPGKGLNEIQRSGILALHRLLNELDPTQDKLGLHRVATYTGDYRWLCKRHYDAYQPNIPESFLPQITNP